MVNSTLGSSLPSGATQYLADYFDIQSQAQLVLPISLYLVGYVLGPVVFAPLSESYGRKGIMVITFVFFTIFTMACAVAPNWPCFLAFRLLCGITASSPIAVVGGLFADIYNEPITRGRAMAFFMAVGPPGTLILLPSFLTCVGDNVRSYPGTYRIRIHLRSQLEVDLFCGSDHCRGIFGVPVFHA